MYTKHTYQDWLATPETERPELARQIVQRYVSSDDFKTALLADRYFRGDNPTIEKKRVLRAVAVDAPGGKGKKRTAMREIIGNQIRNNFFFRFVVQEAQYLLGNGVTVDTPETKAALGLGFDTVMEQIGEAALRHGVAYGYWNNDHLEPLLACVDAASGFVALPDERTGALMVGVQFWRLTRGKPMYYRVFEPDGVTMYRKADDGEIEIEEAKRAYKLRVTRDAIGVTGIEGENYGALPIIPLYGNPMKISELTPSIRSKIDLYDNIVSDFGDNLDRANDVYWVLNNFGGTMSDVAEMMQQIHELRAVVNLSDGMGGGSTATAQTVEVPYEARKTAMELLHKALYADYMALDMDAMTGGSLTNVAIQAAMTNLNLKADRFEWQAFAFVQGVLALIGKASEKIAFKRQQITNRSETVQDIYAMREDIDRETALKLNPYIDEEQIPDIMDAMDAQEITGLSGMRALDRLTEA
ncbi:MAG: phage portal protein [Clostridia bacterium]|nr:phage portal protein [Clostridia bacterium]